VFLVDGHRHVASFVKRHDKRMAEVSQHPATVVSVTAAFHIDGLALRHGEKDYNVLWWWRWE